MAISKVRSIGRIKARGSPRSYAIHTKFGRSTTDPCIVAARRCRAPVRQGWHLSRNANNFSGAKPNHDRRERDEFQSCRRQRWRAWHLPCGPRGSPDMSLKESLNGHQSRQLLAAMVLFAICGCSAPKVSVVGCASDDDCLPNNTCDASHRCVANDGAIGPGSDNCQTSPKPTCVSCASATCTQAEQDACLFDSACRSAMVGYAQCLGSACDGSSDSTCFSRLFPYSNTTVPRCLSGCSADCEMSPIYSDCQLYCGCMLSNCSAPFPTTESCISNCLKLDPAVVRCRWSHCEVAGLYTAENRLHCAHAVGVALCTGPPPPAPPDCPNKSLDGFACTRDSNCCSDNCDLDIKACASP